MLEHPTPIHIRLNITEAFTDYSKRARAEGLDQIPHVATTLIKEAIARAVAEHEADMKARTK